MTASTVPHGRPHNVPCPAVSFSRAPPSTALSERPRPPHALSDPMTKILPAGRAPALLLALLVAGLAGCARPLVRSETPAPAAPAPSFILHDADVFTADPARPRAQALAVVGERIVAVGTDAEILALAGPESTVLDLDGRLVVPGINDAHVHVGPWPAMRGLGLTGSADPAWAVVLDSVRAAAAATPTGTWLAGTVGGAVLDDPAATRVALDAAAPAHPVRLVGFTGHGLLVNTAALRALDIPDDAPDVPGGWYGRVAGTDTLDGRVWEYAHLDIDARTSAALPRAEAVAAYRRLSDRMLGWGVTSVQHMENDRPVGETLAALVEADVPLRWAIYAMPSRVQPGRVPPPPARPAGLPDRVRVVGTKWLLDGTPVERLAALRAAYADRPGWHGRVNFSHDEVRAILQSALDGPGQTALHVVGDSTLALVLRTMAGLAPAETWRSRRVRIEHGDGTMPDLLPAMAALGVVLVQNPLHLALPQVLHARYGPERTPHVQLLRSALCAGVPVALGADAGGSGQNPWLGLMLATRHPTNPAEALTREQALAAYTRGSAFAEGQEFEKGTLAPGLLADLAVLSQNVLDVPPDALPATESVLTMIGGRVVYRAASFPAP